MTDGRFVSYLRVSTARQSASGLGLEAQRETVRTFLNGGSWELLAEFVEVESGKRSDRRELDRALAYCRARRATLVVANVSRLTRSVAFLSRLLEAGVDVRFCDLPSVEGAAGRFMVKQMAAVAELEAGLIAERTRKALAAAKARGVKLGCDRGNLDAVRATGVLLGHKAQTEAADRHAADAANVIVEAKAAGAVSLRQIAAYLNAQAVETSRGKGEWTAVQVKRVLDRTAAAVE